MTINELNPEHPVTSAMHDHWHKIVALIMYKQGLKEVKITMDDMHELQKQYANTMPVVIVEEIGEVLSVRIITEQEGQDLINKQRINN